MTPRPSWACVVLLSAVAASAQLVPSPPAPTTEPTLEELRRDVRIRIAEELAELPRIPAQPLSELLRLKSDGGALFVVTPLRETEGDVTFDDLDPAADGLPPLLRLSVAGKATPELQAPAFFRLTLHRFTDDDMVYAQTGLFAHRDLGQFQLTYDAEGPASHYSVQLIQSPRIGGQLMGSPDEILTLHVRRIEQETGDVTLSLRLTAPDLETLRRKFPRETNAYLRPVFEQLGQLSPLFAADERAAWQVLGVAPPLSTQQREQLEQILAGLEADRFADRQRAQTALRALGQSGALAVRSLDRAKLTPNQNAEIDAFLALYSPLSADELARLAQSPDFLLDCMELDTPDLRAAAWSRLQNLIELPPALKFDPAAPADAREEQVRALRNHLAAAVR